MSAPINKSHMAFELPRQSYIDTSWEEPAAEATAKPEVRHGFTAWIAGFQAWRTKSRALTELDNLSDRELIDMGLNRGDVPRMFDNRYNRDLLCRGLGV